MSLPPRYQQKGLFYTDSQPVYDELIPYWMMSVKRTATSETITQKIWLRD